MGFIFFAVLLGLIPAAIAKNKGRSFGAWWLYGAAIFIIALPHSLLIKGEDGMGELSLSTVMKKCPHCAESIKSEAKVCRYCGRDIQESLIIGEPQPKP